MQLPLAYFDASVIEEVPIDLWRQVFDDVGWLATLDSKRQTFTHADVLDAFEHDDPTDDLLQAIEVLHTLGTEAGRDAIVSAMNDRRVPLETLAASTGSAEFATHLFLAQRSDASLADVFARAQAQVQEGADHRRYNEFVGTEARVVTNLNAKAEALRGEMLRYCQESDLGDHVQVRAFENDGTYVFHVIRGHRVRKPLAVLPGRSVRGTIEYRPVHADLLQYDAAVGRLRIAARAASMVEVYCHVLGRVLFDDEMFFAGEPVCNLKVLQEKGRAAFEDHGVPGVGRVWMTECLWERGDRDLLHIRSTDCFRNVEELRLPLSEGQLVQVKLKFEVVGKSTRPVTVTVRAPSRIEVSQKRHERIVDQLLTKLGIRNPPRGDTEIDLWSLHPWRHPAQVWRMLFGSDTDMLVQCGVLVPIQLDAIPSRQHIDGGHVLDAQPLPSGEFYGVSRAPEIPSRSLSSTDLDALKLDPEQLRLYLRSRFETTGGSATPWAGDELLDLGLIKVGDVSVHLTYSLRQPPRGTGNTLRMCAAGESFALLVPSSRYSGSELPVVMVGRCLPSRGSVVRGIVATCALTGVPAVFSAPEGTRLVVDTRHGQVWVDGLEISGLRPGSHPFRFVETLAKKSPAVVSMKDLTDELSGARKDGDTTARQAKLAAKKHISDAMARAGRTFDEDPFPSAQTGCYRCVLVAYVV